MRLTRLQRLPSQGFAYTGLGCGRVPILMTGACCLEPCAESDTAEGSVRARIMADSPSYGRGETSCADVLVRVPVPCKTVASRVFPGCRGPRAWVVTGDW